MEKIYGLHLCLFVCVCGDGTSSHVTLSAVVHVCSTILTVCGICTRLPIVSGRHSQVLQRWARTCIRRFVDIPLWAAHVALEADAVVIVAFEAVCILTESGHSCVKVSSPS